MSKHTKIFTDHALHCLWKANTLAGHNNQKTIKGDDLFWGIYTFMKQQKQFDVFCSILNISDRDTLEEFFHNKYDCNINSMQISKDKKLPFSKKIQTEINRIVNDGANQLDFIVLFYIAFSDLSTECTQYCKAQDIAIQTIREKCEELLKNPVIHQVGLFAFLDIMHKLLDKLHLHPQQIKTMQIEGVSKMNDINMLLDAVESEIMEKNSKSNSDVSDSKEDKKMTIEYFGSDLTKEYKEGFIDPIIGREKEIDQMIYTLLRKTKNNPLLIGEAGVGKTAIVEGLAQRIAKDDVPEKLKGYKLFMIDTGALVAGTKYRGEFEARMKAILEEASDPTNKIIMFIDELHTIMGMGGQDTNDAAQMIKPMLARGKIKLIGATTFDEYQKHIEKDAALKRRFQEINVDEPSAETTYEIMQGLKETYQDFHGVKITDTAITQSIKLSKRYILNKHLPDKAIDIIDEAAARKSTMHQKLDNDDNYQKDEQKILKLQKKIADAIDKQDYFAAAELKEQEEKIKADMQKIRSSKNIPLHLRPEITPEDIGTVLADKLGIPANMVTESEVNKLKRLETDLQEHIYGQEEAVKAVVKTLTRNRLSVVQRNKPIGSFLFLGPTGVGKTHLAKLIAKDFFGDEKALIRIDMSEFMEKFSISKMIGSPAGYVGYEEGGTLTEQIRRKPYSVLLLDEIEKAAPDVLNILLQILDEGQLKDSKGRMIDFKNTIIVMTSNLGAEEFGKKKATIGFDAGTTKEVDDKQYDAVKDRVMHHVKEHMSPELLNRIDYQLVFKPLTKDILADIFKKEITDFINTWKAETDIAVPRFTKAKIQKIIDEIYDPQYGARPISRYIHDKIEPTLIEKVMNK